LPPKYIPLILPWKLLPLVRT